MDLRNRYLKIWQWTTLLSPLWWVTGLSIAAYHLTAMSVCFRILVRARIKHKGIYTPTSFVFMGGLIVVYFFSLLVHAGDNEFMRVVSGFYNWSFWVMGACLILIFANVFFLRDIGWVLDQLMVIVFYYVILGVVAFILPRVGIPFVSFPTPLYPLTNILGHTPLVEQSLTVEFLFGDWFASLTRSRFNALVPYATAGGAFIALLMVVLWIWSKWNRDHNSVRIFYPLIWVLSAMALLLTLSRTPIVAYAAVALWLFFMNKRHSFIWILFSLCLFVIFLPWINETMNWILDLRDVSTNVRRDLYMYTLQQMDGADWILGKGIKPLNESQFLIPVGSHSIYLSLLYRTGIVGVSLFLGLQANLFIRWYSLKTIVQDDARIRHWWLGLGGAFILVLLCLMTDDIDAPQFLAFIYFSLIGMFEATYRGCMHEAEKSSEISKGD